MKKIILIYSLAFIFTFNWGKIKYFASNASDKYLYIIILAGQSNALGQPGVDVLDSIPSGWEKQQIGIDIWWEGDYLTLDTNGGAFEPMNPVENTRNHIYTDPEDNYNMLGWGVEQKCSHLIRDNKGIHIYIIKSAVGAISITEFLEPSGARWVELERYIRRACDYAESINKIPVLLSLAWLQGESDAGGAYGPYETRMRSFISSVRGINEYTENLPIIMFKLASDFYSSVGTTIINQAFINIAGDTENCYVIETSQYAGDYTGGYVAGHYGATSLLSLGEDWYNFMVNNNSF